MPVMPQLLKSAELAVNGTALAGDERKQDGPRASYTTALTDALIDVALRGVSFATPGHRGGRSCRLTPR
jgi:hypothetical protein